MSCCLFVFVSLGCKQARCQRAALVQVVCSSFVLSFFFSFFLLCVFALLPCAVSALVGAPSARQQARCQRAALVHIGCWVFINIQDFALSIPLVSHLLTHLSLPFIFVFLYFLCFSIFSFIFLFSSFLVGSCVCIPVPCQCTSFSSLCLSRSPSYLCSHVCVAAFCYVSHVQFVSIYHDLFLCFSLSSFHYFYLTFFPRSSAYHPLLLCCPAE